MKVETCKEPTNAASEMALINVEQMLLRENGKKENKALGLIQQGLDDVILSKVSNANSLKKIWDTLEYCYQGVMKELTASLISHESKMSRYDDSTLENAFKYQLQLCRGRGRGRSSNRGQGDRVANQRHPRDNCEHEEKYQQSPSNLSRSYNRTSH